MRELELKCSLLNINTSVNLSCFPVVAFGDLLFSPSQIFSRERYLRLYSGDETRANILQLYMDSLPSMLE